MTLDQIVIAVFGVAAVWLSQDAREGFRRWAPVCGLISQPAWAYSAYQHQQWAILALTAVYTIGWLRGFRTYWIKAPIKSAGGKKT